MSEVSAWACKNLVDAANAAGHSTESLVEGLSITAAQLEQRLFRLPWDDYAQIVERTAAIVGGAEAFERACADFGTQPPTGIIKMLAGTIVSTRQLYTFGAKWLGPSAFLHTKAAIEELPDGRLRQTVEIREGFRGCEMFFYGLRGVLRTTPRILGQPDARVHAEITPRRAVFTVELPRTRVWPTLRRQRVFPEDVAETLRELNSSHNELQRSLEEARRTGASLRAQTDRLETLNRLSRELARHTELERLADALLELLHTRFRFGAVRLSIAPRVGGELEVARQSGARTDPPSASHLLRTSTGVVGRIEVWSTDGAETPVDDVQLGDLLPWISLALDNARSFEALNEQTKRLAAEIEERERTEQRLAHAMRLEAIGRLAGGLAHDFNNVLTAISGYAELVSGQLPPEDPAQRDLEEIHAVSRRATGLISQVLAFSRREVVHPRTVDLNALIGAMEPVLRTLVGENIDLAILAGARQSAVLADPGRIEQVIVNLATNARDAMESGGKLVIETANVAVEPGAAGHPALEVGDYVQIRVRDTGVGMDADTRARMYEPFFTTKPVGRGTGLGLSTVYGTVTHFGGALDVDSEPGRGTAISIYLPRSDAADEPREVAGPVQRLAGGETLLLVEDDGSIRSVMSRFLRSRGFQVLAAEHGEAAIGLCGSHDGPIDLLFTDVVMPGMDGRALARRVEELRPELRGVLFTSGHVQDPSAFRDEPGRSAFVHKPYDPKEVLERIRSALDGSD